MPTLLLRPAAGQAKLPVVVLCDDRGKAALMSTTGLDSPIELARKGQLVALPDVRFVGELALASFAGLSQELLTFRVCSPLGEGAPESFDGAWERNALLWGRPLPGMAATDIRAVVDYVVSRTEADQTDRKVVARGKPAVAALFAAALDDRITSLDLDLGGRCFAKRNLPLVPFVLRHGDVLQWAALLADRRLALAGVPAESGDWRCLQDAFAAAGNTPGLRAPP